MKKKFNQLWEWIFNSDEEDLWYSYPAGRVKAAILAIISFVVIAGIIFFAVWLDNYIKYHF
ncbi:MAG: hypothetical protein H6582_12445 [Crocinitomicaceae bacterium]|nr:hypothetical protein [Crocinitomicaceae bacterium]